jgi:hypothetical protein
MKTETESRRGWNGSCVLIGRTVRVRAAGFGRDCRANVIAFPPHPHPTGTTLIQLAKVGKTKAGWAVGNQTLIHAAWLEGEPMI